MRKQVESSSLSFLDVITSDHFVNGHRWPGLYDEPPIEVGGDRHSWHNDIDPTRGTAKFLVLSVALAGDTHVHGGPDSVWTQVTAKRLNDDGSFNPKGEVICFKADGRAESAVREVTRIGKMSISFVPAE